MQEGWKNDDYLVLFSEAESRAKAKAYGIVDYVPGYRLVGLRGWDEFIIADQTGALFIIPTVPLDLKYLESFVLPTGLLLEADNERKDKVKWYVTPLVFGGDPNAEENLTWVSHDQHADLVVWWNNAYRKAKAQDAAT